jgi:DNA-binding transcriptional MerR regulator
MFAQIFREVLDSGVNSRVYSWFVNAKLGIALQIGTVAVRSGLTVDTIRFYEKQGLVAKPHRSSGGFRLYNEDDLDRLSFVTRAQALGFSLVEIRELLLLRYAGSETCSHVHDLLNQKLAAVQQKIADLRKLESQLKDAGKRCDRALAKECTGSCPVMDEIAGSRKEV